MSLSTVNDSPSVPNWMAVASIFFGVFGIVASEFAPAGLLTPIATDLRITEGLAGQAVSATAFVGLAVSLVISLLLRTVDRKWGVLAFTALLSISNVLVAIAPSMPLLIVGRLILGVAVGGLWSLAPSLALRLVPIADVPKALAIIFAGVSVATVAMLPLATALETIIGWRKIFYGFSAFGVVVLAMQAMSLPSMPVTKLPKGLPVFNVLRKPGIPIAVFTMLLCFSGHFAIYTYVRPLLQDVANFSAHGVAAVLFVYGLANLTGNFISVRLLRKSLSKTLMFMPIVIAIAAGLLTCSGKAQAIAVIAMILWGVAYATLPVGWSTWTTRAAPGEAEAAGGLFVATSNLAVTSGVAIGGSLFDTLGVISVFVIAGMSLLLSAVTVQYVKIPKH